MKPATKAVVGILLAAGRGTRFGGDKLLAPLAGECVGATACRRLLVALPYVVAVVRSDDAALAAALGAAGARIIRCADADDGMGASLACGVRATPDAGIVMRVESSASISQALRPAGNGLNCRAFANIPQRLQAAC